MKAYRAIYNSRTSMHVFLNPNGELRDSRDSPLEAPLQAFSNGGFLGKTVTLEYKENQAEPLAVSGLNLDDPNSVQPRGIHMTANPEFYAGLQKRNRFTAMLTITPGIKTQFSFEVTDLKDFL